MSQRLLGPRSATLMAGVRLDEDGPNLRLRAEQTLSGIATGRFGEPAVYVAFRPGDAEGATATRFGGYTWTQFALPIAAGSELDFCFHHGNALVSPPVVFPLFAEHPDDGACLLAPLDGFHEQVVAVVDGELRWGWHGDLDHVPGGFSTTLGVFEGTSIRELLDAWGRTLRERSGVEGAGRYADVSTSHLSYWTDNGAAYWYRRESGRDITETLAQKMSEVRERSIPVNAVELDSWFYPHERTRAINEVGYLDAVPPTGMLRWEPREDILPDGMAPLHEALGRPPLILHSRHISAASPYVEEDTWWTHHGVAHPRDPRFFERFMADAASWGATCYEQDWMWVIWFAMAPLREAPGRAHAWQVGLDAAAAAHDLSLIWCMATPADLAEATRLPRVVAVRTCDDYRFAADPALLWIWFLVVNAMAGALGLWPFKDVFFSARCDEPGTIDGDPHPEIEALLSALSAGPVGIGDRIGRSDPELIARTCRADGLLVKPDRPIAALDGCLLGEPRRGERLLWADAGSGPWRYVVALHAAEGEAPIDDVLELGAEALVYDWRAGTAEVSDRIEASLAHRDWSLHVVCPIENDRALVGDPNVFATMGDRRILCQDARTVEVVGAAGEQVTIRCWSAQAGLHDRAVEIPDSGSTRIRLD